MIQLWFKPETSGQKADYEVFNTVGKKVTRIYGGDEKSRFQSQTTMEVIHLKKGERFFHSDLFQAYIVEGSLSYDNKIIHDGDFIEDDNLDVEALEKSQLILIYLQS